MSDNNPTLYYERFSGRWLPGEVGANGRIVFLNEQPATVEQRDYTPRDFRARLYFGTGLKPTGSDAGITEESFLAKYNQQREALEVELILNCPGGTVTTGFKIADRLKNDRRLKRACIMGECYSATNIIAQACDTIYAHPDAVLMIHDPYFPGDVKPTPEDLQVLEDCRLKILNLLDERRPNIGRDRIEDWLSNETWFTADEAVACGLIDGLLDPNVWQVHDAQPVNLNGLNRHWHKPSITAHDRRVKADFDDFMKQRSDRQRLFQQADYERFAATEPRQAVPPNPKPAKPKQPIRFPIEPNRPVKRSVPDQAPGCPHKPKQHLQGIPMKRNPITGQWTQVRKQSADTTTTKSRRPASVRHCKPFEIGLPPLPGGCFLSASHMQQFLDSTAEIAAMASSDPEIGRMKQERKLMQRAVNVLAESEGLHHVR